MTRRLLDANIEYARKIGVLRRGVQQALSFLRRGEVGEALRALEAAYSKSLSDSKKLQDESSVRR